VLLACLLATAIVAMSVPLTMLTSCVTALALPAALVVLLRPRFIFGTERIATPARRGQLERPAA
jgi:hypothetical protein